MNDITINGISYAFKEPFDMNLTLDYENTSWQHWHIVREFVSNALDSVYQDTSRIEITHGQSSVYIRDYGQGYPLVYAKRIGASAKKNDPSSIGQFGEGTKMAVLTCIRNNIRVQLASENWMVIPTIQQTDGQSVLFYDIYEAESSIAGSLVILEATEEIMEIVEHLENYFLHFRPGDFLYGDSIQGILLGNNGMGRLYNKGVFIKTIPALYSYGITVESLNRDRDLIDNYDIAYRVRDLWEQVDQPELIDQLLNHAVGERAESDNLVEFELRLRSHNPSLWAQRFHRIFGPTACIQTNDIAAREALCMQYAPVHVHYHCVDLLKEGGVKTDRNCLSADYEYVWARQLTREEESVKSKLQRYAAMLKLPTSTQLKVFEEYRNHALVEGAFDPSSNAVYLKRQCLKDGMEQALCVYLHELTHCATGEDDLSRVFAESLCRQLTTVSMTLVEAVGWPETARISAGHITLPESFSLSQSDLTRATVALVSNEMHIVTSNAHIRCILPVYAEENAVRQCRIIVRKNAFTIRIPAAMKEGIPDWITELPCYIRSMD